MVTKIIFFRFKWWCIDRINFLSKVDEDAATSFKVAPLNVGTFAALLGLTFYLWTLLCESGSHRTDLLKGCVWIGCKSSLPCVSFIIISKTSFMFQIFCSKFSSFCVEMQQKGWEPKRNYKFWVFYVTRLSAGRLSCTVREKVKLLLSQTAVKMMNDFSIFEPYWQNF